MFFNLHFTNDLIVNVVYFVSICGIKTPHRAEWGWVDGEGWPDYSLSRMSSYNKAFIITSQRVAAVWELCTGVFFCFSFFLTGVQKKSGSSSTLVGRFKQQQILYGSLSVSKQAVFQEGGNRGTNVAAMENHTFTFWPQQLYCLLNLTLLLFWTSSQMWWFFGMT